MFSFMFIIELVWFSVTLSSDSKYDFEHYEMNLNFHLKSFILLELQQIVKQALLISILYDSVFDFVI